MSNNVKAPLQSGSIRSVGIFWSLLFIAVGAVAIREGLVVLDVIKGSTWLADLARQVDGLRSDDWLLAVAIVSGLLALWLLVITFKPRRRQGIALKANSSIFITPKAAASIALSSARQVDGVVDATAKTGNSKLDLRVKATSTDAELQKKVRNAVAKCFQAFNSKPNLKVRLRQHKVDL